MRHKANRTNLSTMTIPTVGAIHELPLQKDLPEGWVKSSMNNVCTIILGQSPPSSTYNVNGEGLPFFQGKAEFGERYPIVVKWCSKPKKVAQKNDILISVRAPVGPTNIAPSECCIGRGLAAFRPLEDAEYLYIFYFLRSIEHELSEMGTGTTFKAISGSDLRSISIPFAPLEQQKSIVAEIEKQFSRLDEAVANLKRVKANLKRYKAAVLKAAVEGKLTEEWRNKNPDVEPAENLLKRILAERRKKWEEDYVKKYVGAHSHAPKDDSWKKKYKEPAAPDTAKLPELPKGWAWAGLEQLGEVIGGLTQNRKREKYSKKLPYLRVANVYANELRLEHIKEIGILDEELDRSLLQKNDLLIVEGNGSRDQIGRLAVWDGSINPCVHQNHLIKVRLVDSSMAPYILWWFLSLQGREFVIAAASSTSGLYTLSISKVGNLPIPLLPLEEQQQIMEEVDLNISITNAFEEEININIKRAERLRQSILKKAFRGILLRN